ncbi:MAG: hypothetical protein RLZZ282_1379, partial [Verrucomicrobiota bacterium]
MPISKPKTNSIFNANGVPAFSPGLRSPDRYPGTRPTKRPNRNAVASHATS